MHIAVTPRTASVAAPSDDLCNLLPVAATAQHLRDRKLGDDLRPLARAGLAAIRQATNSAVR